MNWIVTANTNECRIYNYEVSPPKLTLLHTINHPENKLKSHELGTDRPGHYQAGASSRGAFSPHHELHEIKVDDFSRELAEKLNEERNKNHYSSLIFMMPAQMEGLVLQHLHKQVGELIQHILQKNIMHLSQHELLAYIQEHLPLS